MHKFISAAALMVAGLLSTPTQAQTAPENGWNAHIAGCFAFDASFAQVDRGFERLVTPATAQRVSVVAPDLSGVAANVRMAVWRQDCPNNPNFPILMVRFEQISPFGLLSTRQNRDFELIQGGVTTFAETIGTCSDRNCQTTAQAVADEATIAAISTVAIAQARDPNVLLRNGFQFRLRGTTETVTIGGSGGGTGDLTLNGRLNGTYFDPARSGEGIMVDFFDLSDGRKGVFLSWYTYDDAGNLLWVVGNTTLAPNATQVDVPMIATRGGRFGPLFRPSDIQRSGWGTVNIRFPSCSSAIMRYQRLQDGQTGQYTMGRFGLASGVSC